MSFPDESSSGLLEQAMVVAFPQQDPKVCQVSFRVGVPMLFLQTASLETGQMRLGERKSLDLRKAGRVVSDEEKVSILSKARAGQPPHLIVDLHIDDTTEISMWMQALQTVLRGAEEQPDPEDKGERHSPTGSQRQPASALTSARSHASSEVEEECVLLRAKSQKLQQRIAGLEAISERREKQMKKLLKRLDGAMQMLDALQDMCGQQRKVISTQQTAILALKEEGAVDEEENEEEEEEDEVEEDEDPAEGVGAQAFDPEAPGSEQQIMALLKQADQMERALRQIEATGGRQGTIEAMESAGLLSENFMQAGEEEEGGSVEEILGRLNTLEQEKAKFEEMVRQAQSGRSAA
ncbi:unnamed protein product [Symbiodinium pilosum]|uniref:PH domain-containing protein n=1 Tax=Symbiodinium pilosum TaxID=2952 RepID=A0A812P5J2_SYMPI|nr:unnamed protein product [Symbiodinium pilosum]